jgi:glycosyltransferase involved in cell wall biosynthesis
MDKIAVVIPAYNAENSLEELVTKIQKIISLYDIFVVNDGSTDKTAEILKKLNCNIIIHEQNKGKGSALKSAFTECIKRNYSAVITIDADLQHNPDFIPEFVKFYENSDYDIIIGARERDIKIMPFQRILSNTITSFIVSKRIGQKIIDSQSGYRLIKTKVLKEVNLETSKYDTETEILLKAGLKGFRIGFVQISTIYGSEKSSIRGFRDTFSFIKLIIKSFRW